MQVVDALARAFADEGTTTVFGLMGDGNMYWMARMGELPGVDLVHARHENAAVAMADGYARVTGEVGVASVTSGPGVTQIATSLVASAQHGTPLVVFAGDTPSASAFNLQAFDQAPFAAACGAGFVAARRVERIGEDVALAFYKARVERRPVLLSVPWDLQEQEDPWGLEHSGSNLLVPPHQRVEPDPEAVAAAVELLASAERPIVLAGRGAIASGARDALEAVAERTGALLATSLRAKGWFEGRPWDAGVCGAFSTNASREEFASADVVLGVGARMGYFTTEAGYLFPQAQIIQVDAAPVGYVDGQRVADLVVRGDARSTVLAIDRALGERGVTGRTGYRLPEVQARLAVPDEEPAVDVAPGTIDPRAAIQELDAAVPKDWTVVIGAGHFWNFAAGGLSGRQPDRYVFTYDFGVIGQGLPTAMGAARGRPDRPVALIEGDGSLIMNVQELEAVARHRIPVLMFVMNDGGYGAEVHKMRSKGFLNDEAVFGATDLAAVATAFGLRSHRVEGPGAIADVVAAYLADPAPTLVDVRVDPSVMAKPYRRLFFGQITSSS